MRAVTWTIVGAAVLLAACGGPVGGVADSGTMTPEPDAGSEPPDAGMTVPDAGTAAEFAPEPLPAGAALWLKVDLTTPARPRLEVWAKELALVRGVAFHVGVDAAQLKVDSATPEPVTGADRSLARVRAGDAAFGLVRLASAPAEIDLTAETKLAVLQLSALTPVDTRLALNRVVVRRADGSYVAAKVAGGRLVLP